MAELWANWAGEQRCAPERIETPAGEEELAEVVARAAQGGRVRAAGTGHSFTDIACTDGTLVRIERLNRILDVDSDAAAVTVQAGITLAELGSRLAELGLALENQGDIDRQTLAGALSTATHGTGARFGNLSSRVAAARLVTASGEVLDLTEHSDGEGLRAARVALGSLGVLSAVTLRCVPLFSIRRIDEPRPLAETLERLDETVDGADHFEFFLFPYADHAIARTSERGDFEPVRVDPRGRYLQEVVLENRLFDLVCRAGRAFPALIPPLQRRISRMLGATKTDHSHRVYASERNVRFTEMEYAIPREHAAAAVRRVIELVRRRRLPIVFPLEVRFTAADDAFLSTAHGRDTCYVAVHQYTGMEFESYFRAVEAIMDDYEGRPHWGKRHYQSAATLRRRYPEWDRFQAVRARLDPSGVFENDYTRRVLGPVAAPVTA